MKKALLIAVLAACGGSKKPAVANAGGSGSASASDASSPTGPVTIEGVEQGDDSCYLEITDDKGAAQTLPADFDLCPGAPKDVSKMIHSKVTLGWQTANVLSASCEGDVDCGKTDRENIVITVTAAP